MPLPSPTLDDRKYQQILDEALARIPVHNPEWTNFNKSDPGVTLIEVFSFLTESLLFRANQIPERNRRKFLSLLGQGLQPGASARGLVSFSFDGPTPATFTLNGDIELRAGQIPFRTEAGLDVLPIEAQAFYKRPAPDDQGLIATYNQLYAALRDTTPPAELQLYQTTLFSPRATEKLNLGRDTTDQSLWIALLMRPRDKPYAAGLRAVREALCGKTLSLGIVPVAEASGRVLRPGGPARSSAVAVLNFQVPSLPAGGILPEAPSERNARYRTIKTAEVPELPTVVEITLPGTAPELELWSNLDPLESGSRDFPPSLDGMEQDERLITWIRVVPSAPAQTSLLWTGINTVFVRQRVRVLNELLPAGNGEPDQASTLARRPVLPGSLVLEVTPDLEGEPWTEIDDLAGAGPEVPVRDPRSPPGATPADNRKVKVFMVDSEAGQIRFGDGLRGARPPSGATLRVSYDYGVGLEGNVGPNVISAGAALPPAIRVTNPVPTWGGANPESVEAGEQQIPRFLQHRDRLVNAEDFETITMRTPGVAVGRVDVLSAYHPAFTPNQPGNAPGAVTVMVLPRYPAPTGPGAGPDTFLDAVACWLDPKRLVTTEVLVRRPEFQPIWVSIGLELIAGVAVSSAREAVEQAIRNFLSPLPLEQDQTEVALTSLTASRQPERAGKGWPLSKPVVALELAAIANRVAGVAFTRQVLLADADGNQYERIPMVGLELPSLVGLSVAIGDALPIDALRGAATVALDPQRPPVVPVPIIPEGC